MIRALRFLIFYGTLLALWQALASWGPWPDYVFPSPRGMLSSLQEMLEGNELTLAMLASLKRLLVGYGIALAAGISIGVTLAIAPPAVEDTFGSLIQGLQNLPSVCWLPVAVLWFGLKDSAIVFVVVMGSVLAIAMPTLSGLRRVPALWVNAARTLGARGISLQLKVMLPAALPGLVDGMKHGWSFAWRSLMAGELLFVTIGLGHLMNMGRELNDVNRVVSMMLVIIVLGVVTDKILFHHLERAIARRWGYARA